MFVSTLVMVYICIHQFYQACFVIFMGYRTLLELVIFYAEEFDIYLGMNCLSPYYAILYCYSKNFIVDMSRMNKLEQESILKRTPLIILLVIYAQKLV